MVLQESRRPGLGLAMLSRYVVGTWANPCPFLGLGFLFSTVGDDGHQRLQGTWHSTDVEGCSMTSVQLAIAAAWPRLTGGRKTPTLAGSEPQQCPARCESTKSAGGRESGLSLLLALGQWCSHLSAWPWQAPGLCPGGLCSSLALLCGALSAVSTTPVFLHLGPLARLDCELLGAGPLLPQSVSCIQERE